MPIRGPVLRSLTALALAGLLGAAACDADATSTAAKQADAVANTAGTVMLRGLGPIPAQDAAWQVVGTLSDRSIEALQADGTTYQGTVVLRITTGLDAGQGARPVTRCYRYLFRRRIDDVHPQSLASCPTRPALSLTSPPPAVAVTEGTRSTLIAALNTLTPAELNSPAAIRTALLPKFPPPLVLITSGPGTGVNAAIFVTIMNTQADFATSCVTAYLAPGRPWDVQPVANGPACRGG